MHPKIVFLGSSRFAVPSLKALVADDIHPVVVTKPDKPASRGKSIRGTPVKETALALNLPLFQPDSLNTHEAIERLKIENPDILISIAYGEYIPPEILEIPKFKTVNVHPSLLPKYRGAAPVPRALMAGEKLTGVTLAYVTKGWDEGDILMQEAYPVRDEENAGTLLDALAYKGAALLMRAMPLLLHGKLDAHAQDESQATYAPKIKEDETWIQWSDPAKEIVDLVRGLSPDPCARFHHHDQVIKAQEAKQVPGSATPGEIVELDAAGPVIGAKEGNVLLLKVQPQNRKIMTGKDFINGYHLQVGQVFHS